MANWIPYPMSEAGSEVVSAITAGFFVSQTKRGGTASEHVARPFQGTGVLFI